jgi:Zn-dependent peptidase ImmA (M78 family)
MPEDPISPFALAEHLDVVVLGLRDMEIDCLSAVRYLSSNTGQRDFSAITIHRAGRRAIVHNDWHHPKRQAANISHELAHAVLHHPPHEFLAGDGQRNYEASIETEANWLGPALLISEEAALWIVEEGLSEARASDHFGVSTALVRMRVLTTGAHKRIAARRRKAA